MDLQKDADGNLDNASKEEVGDSSARPRSNTGRQGCCSASRHRHSNRRREKDRLQRTQNVTLDEALAAIDRFYALAQEKRLSHQQTNEMLRSSGIVMRYMNNVNEAVNRRRSYQNMSGDVEMPLNTALFD